MTKNKISNEAVFKISKEDAKKISLEDKREMDAFWGRHCASITDPLTLIVKCHLFIESSVNELLTHCLPNPRRILEKSSFSFKLHLFEALNLSPNKILVKKIREINKLRNDFVHDLDKKLTTKDIKEITKDLRVDPSATPLQKLLSVLHYIIGYLHALKTMEKIFPFALICVRNKKILNRDKGYIHSKGKFREVYPYKEIREILENLKL